MRSGSEGLQDQMRWTFGCLVGAAAMIGTLILVFLVAITLSPPVWVQVVLGLGLVAGGGTLTWLVVSALGQSRSIRTEMGPRPISSTEDSERT